MRKESKDFGLNEGKSIFRTIRKQSQYFGQGRRVNILDKEGESIFWTRKLSQYSGQGRSQYFGLKEGKSIFRTVREVSQYFGLKGMWITPFSVSNEAVQRQK